MDYLDQLEASGSTNIAGALDEALRGADQDPEVRSGERLSLVLFVTDGEPTVGDRDPARIAALAARERGHSRVFTFGLGADVNAGLLEQLASEGRGTAQFVRPEESVERAVGIVASRLVDPVLTDVRITTEDGVRLSRMLPVAPLDLFAGQDLVLLARYSGHGRSRVTFEGRHAGEMVRWSSVVDFPEHEIDNPFVARLWATQRVGYLSMEKRKALGSGESTAEIDDEIRSLGERFGIPTEFTSYLVQEPGVVADRAAGGGRRVAGIAGGVAAPAPAAARAMSFEQAKVASEQRAATSIAAMDTMALAGASGANSADVNGAIRRAGTHTFVRRDGVWVDTRYHEGSSAVRVVRIKPFSKAYFDLLQQLPELRDAFALGDRVIVAGRQVVVRLDESGSTELSGAEVRDVVAEW